MSGAHVPDVLVSRKIKCENPFPNWNPITKISYIELDIIVSKLVCICICTYLFILGNQFTYDYVKLKIGYFSNRIPVWEGIFTLENLIN